MKRRQFLWICGCTGVGMLIGLSSSGPARANQRQPNSSLSARRIIWMHGSVRTGCARLPQAEPPHPEPAAMILNEYR